MNDIELMYRENILDNYKNPRNKGKIDNPTVHHREFNPLCGDEIELFLTIEENKVVDVKFFGQGCAISQASVSILTEKIKGKTLEELKQITKEDIFEMIGVPLSPVRIKCGLLGWDTMKNSILIYEKYVNEEENGKQ
tara:strand:+ start:7865 stop:8275 length:411 start_codon:yes stop_codon:yes gene_type:complete